jgi:hypothetical protein
MNSICMSSSDKAPGTSLVPLLSANCGVSDPDGSLHPRNLVLMKR